MSGPALTLEPTWTAPPGVRALTSLRQAGNLAAHVGDCPKTVAANRTRLVATLRLPAEPRWLRQVHGVVVADLDRDDAPAEADAAVAARPGIVCAVLTADCLPVLLAAANGAVVGVAHAGWRGLAAGVVENTVGAMRKKSPEAVPLVAWLGPAISAANFEVGKDVRDAFVGSDPAAETAFIANARGRWQCDLYQLARLRLARLGVEDVTGGEHCTYAEPERFYSYRRDVGARGAVTTGRMATLIWRA